MLVILINSTLEIKRKMGLIANTLQNLALTYQKFCLKLPSL